MAIDDFKRIADLLRKCSCIVSFDSSKDCIDLPIERVKNEPYCCFATRGLCVVASRCQRVVYERASGEPRFL